MICAFCDESENVLLPMQHKDISGLRQVLVCARCGIERQLYCDIHGYPKTAHESGVLICLYCLEAELDDLEDKASCIKERLMQELPPEQWAVISQEATEFLTYVHDGLNLSILRFLLIRAKVMKIELGELINRVCDSSSVAEVFMCGR